MLSWDLHVFIEMNKYIFIVVKSKVSNMQTKRKIQAWTDLDTPTPFDTYTIICTVNMVIFSSNRFLLVFSDYLEHSWNRLKYHNSMSILSSQKTLTESSAKQWWFHAAYDGIFV